MPQTYTVASGDTLSAIAGRFYGNPDLWPALWWVNKGSIPDPNKIEAGQHLTLSQWHPQADWLTTRAMKAADPPPPPQPAPQVTMASYQPQHADAQTSDPPDQQQQGNGDGAPASGDGSYGHPNYCGDGDGDGWDVPCQDHSSSPGGDNASTSNGDNAPVTTSGDSPQSSGSSGSGGGGQMVSLSSYSGFQACVIARESGGNSQVMNSSGHYGLYQFAASTWAAYGGNPATFGHASVAEQNRIFANAMATPGGKNNWSPYDGC